MRKVKTYPWQVGIIVSISVWLVGLSYIAWADGHLQIIKKEKKLVLKGKISEALGEYDSHLKGAVEYLICGHNGKEYESIVVVEATAKEIHDALSQLDVQVGVPPGYDEQKDEPTPPTGTAVIISVEWKDGNFFINNERYKRGAL